MRFYEDQSLLVLRTLFTLNFEFKYLSWIDIEHKQVIIVSENCDPFGCKKEIRVDVEASKKLEEENLNLQESITELKDSIRRKLIEVAKSNGKHIDEELEESDLLQFFGEGEEELLETVRELLGIGKKISSKNDGGAENGSRLGIKRKMTLRDAISELSQDDKFLPDKNGEDDAHEKFLKINRAYEVFI
mgnify:CR=1 FL=1